MSKPLYVWIARKLAALSTVHEDIASDDLDWLEKEYLPSGSGFDAGTKIDREASGKNKIVLTTSFHHMNDAGYYDGWTEHKIIIRPDLEFGFTFTISGRDKRGIKDYIGDIFQNALSMEINHYSFPR